jgi:hypothetical protein
MGMANPGDTLTVYLYNIDTSLNTDSYIIRDNVANTSFSMTLQGGATGTFTLVAGDDGYGDCDITNTQSTVPNNFPFVRDGDTESV